MVGCNDDHHGGPEKGYGFQNVYQVLFIGIEEMCQKGAGASQSTRTAWA